MGKKLICWLLVACMGLALCACAVTTSLNYTYSIDNGDKIGISLDVAGGYDMDDALPFTIKKDGLTVSQGTFIQGEAYDSYVSAAQEDPDAQVLDSGTRDGNEYVFWCYDGTEYNYVIRIAGSQTALLLGNLVSEESARECFERLTITAA